MMVPREIGCPKLVNALCVLGYEATRQNSSHVRVTTLRDEGNQEVIPFGHSIKSGTLSGILKHVATHHRMSVNELLKMLSL
ncbi:MAG: type II toxin-antitoxin system HicA family toxin [Terracidiphilus sp.]